MHTNERFIKIPGKIPWPKELKLDEAIEVTIDGVTMMFSVVKVESGTNNDGTSDETFKLKHFYTS